VRALQATCEQVADLDLKVTIREKDDEEVPSQALVYADGRLAAYCGVDRGRDAEVCGMVHPGYRQQDIGTNLLDFSLGVSAAMGYGSALVICEDREPVAVEWLRRRGAVLDSSELRMVLALESGPPRPADAPRLALRRAETADRAALVALLEQGFGQMTTDMLHAMLGGLDHATEEILVGSHDGALVATLRLYRTPRRSMVYGLVVDERLRGRGHGRAAMLAALDIVAGRGEREVSLEVLPDNAPAVALYRSLGFRTSTTYRYMRLPTG
jgi:ribosomal protein S18 acetylase RimI-like enzyme